MFSEHNNYSERVKGMGYTVKKKDEQTEENDRYSEREMHILLYPCLNI